MTDTVQVSAGADRFRAGARASLLNAAELLFAEQGIQGVSLRQIAAQAGHRNNSAVHYHFGDKTGLIAALLADRVGRIEVIRKRTIAECGGLDRCNAVTLLGYMWQPLLEIDEDRGSHLFIRFQLACHLDNSRLHPLATDPEHYPASHAIMEAIHRLHPSLAVEEFHYRMGLVALMFWSAVCWHKTLTRSASQHRETPFSLDRILALAASALDAPA